MEVYDAATNRWERAPEMTKGRHVLNLVVAEDELYAVGGDRYVNINLSIEKLSKVSGAWQVVAEIEEYRWGCGAAAVGSKIYVFGGYGGGHESTWNAFDVTTEQWASASIPAEKRKLSDRKDFAGG